MQRYNDKGIEEHKKEMSERRIRQLSRTPTRRLVDRSRYTGSKLREIRKDHK